MLIDYYQTISDLNIKGRKNTPEEFDKIGLPKNLKNKFILDIGCNIGAFLIESVKRGAFIANGIEPNLDWRLLANGIAFELKMSSLVVLKSLDDLIIGEGYDLILLLSVLHVCKENPQKLLDRAYEMTKHGGLLIIEINDRLQKIPVILPKEAKLYGKNKDNRSVYHCIKL